LTITASAATRSPLAARERDRARAAAGDHDFANLAAIAEGDAEVFGGPGERLGETIHAAAHQPDPSALDMRDQRN
jgi:hypothetical protein